MTPYSNLLPATTSDPKGRSAYDWQPSDAPGPAAGVLTIKQPRTYTRYVVCEIPTPWDGRGFHLAKITAGSDADADAYDVFIGRNRQDVRCECRGWLRWGKPCKHLLSLIDLVANDQL